MTLPRKEQVLKAIRIQIVYQHMSLSHNVVIATLMTKYIIFIYSTINKCSGVFMVVCFGVSDLSYCKHFL